MQEEKKCGKQTFGAITCLVARHANFKKPTLDTWALLVEGEIKGGIAEWRKVCGNTYRKTKKTNHPFLRNFMRNINSFKVLQLKLQIWKLKCETRNKPNFLNVWIFLR